MTMRQYLATVLVVWTAACIAAFFYSQQQHIPANVVWAVVPAFLLELAFYLGVGFEAVRNWFAGLGSKWTRALVLIASGLTPYLLLSAQTSTFNLRALGLLFLVVAIAACWYARGQRALSSDLLFLTAMGTVYLAKVFGRIYVRPWPHVDTTTLGRLMWIHVGLFAVLGIRSMPEIRFSFVPTWREWRIGTEQYLLFLPVAALVSYLIGFARFRPQALPGWELPLVALGTLLAFLWVVGLAEEFFFRAFLQQSIAIAAHSPLVGLIVASVLFGAAHLLYNRFPNWKFAVMAALAGLFYGTAMLRAKSVRASIVAHALTVTTWRVLFTG